MVVVETTFVGFGELEERLKGLPNEGEVVVNVVGGVDGMEGNLVGMLVGIALAGGEGDDGVLAAVDDGDGGSWCWWCLVELAIMKKMVLEGESLVETVMHDGGGGFFIIEELLVDRVIGREG